jgi:hypothetical protein
MLLAQDEFRLGLSPTGELGGVVDALRPDPECPVVVRV